jgi:hypothetical protein
MARRLGAALAALAVGPSTAQAALIHQPATGISVQQDGVVHFDWAWDSDEYATSSIVFTQSPDAVAPIWMWTSGQANAEPGRIVVSDCAYGYCSPFLSSNANVTFAAARFTPGVWYWRLCNKSIYGEDDKCGLDAEIRAVTITPLPAPPAATPAPTATPSPAPAPAQEAEEEDPRDKLKTLSMASARSFARKYVKRYSSYSLRRMDQTDCYRTDRLTARCTVMWHHGRDYWSSRFVVTRTKSGLKPKWVKTARRRY